MGGLSPMTFSEGYKDIKDVNIYLDYVRKRLVLPHKVSI